jgi:portal protein
VGFWKKAWQFLTAWRTDLRAAAAKYFVTREVVKVLALTHAKELQDTPRNEWSMVRQRQIEEIQAVRDGNQFDIVDRRSWPYPYLPEALHRLNQPVLKNTPYNLRRFSETPVPRRAINLVKNSVLSFPWEIVVREDIPNNEDPELKAEREQRIHIATESFKRPNDTGESSRDLQEMMLEDFLTVGAGCAEYRLTPDADRPFKMWAVDASTIRIFLDWTESTPDRPRYAQMTGLKGERGITTFLSDELMYIRDNIRTATPFGLGRLEVCFNIVNSFLGVQDMSGKAGSDQVHKTWLWWEQSLNPAHLQIIRRHIINEIEGQAKVSMVAGAKAPQVIDVHPVTPEDLLIDWQKFCIQIIGVGFDLNPQDLGLDESAPKATSQVLSDSTWKFCIIPVATRFQETLTRQWLHGLLGWKDLEFRYKGLEDPDQITRTVIHQRLWSMSSITPEEIRKKNNLPKLPGPFSKLTMFEQQLVLMSVQAKLAGGASGGASGGGGMSMGRSSGGMGGGMGSGTSSIRPPSSGALGTGGTGLQFSSDVIQAALQQVPQMQPDQIQMWQELGLLPPDSEDMMNQMNQQQPGILDQLSDELTTYFKQELATKQADEVQPAPITQQQRNQQIQKFLEEQHQESLAEIVINRRGVFGPSVNSQVRKNPLRGKYPRSSGGGFVDPNKDRTLPMDNGTSRRKRAIGPGKEPNHYRVGRGAGNSF